MREMKLIVFLRMALTLPPLSLFVVLLLVFLDALAVSLDLGLLADEDVAPGGRTGALDVRRRRRGRAGTVALVGGGARHFCRQHEEAAARTRVVDLHHRPEVVFLGSEGAVGEEEGVGAVVRDGQKR